MALPLGKLTIIVGAGLVGSVLAKEGRLPSFSDAVSGAFKVVLRQLSRGESASTKPNARNDSLLQQVNSLREELQLLVSNRPITIVTTTSGSASSKYSIIVVVIGVGYGYIWWKGWKLSGMMFATKRSLSDACDRVSKQLENVYSAIAATKRQLSSRIDGVDGKIEECVGNTTDTKEEVSKLQGDLRSMDVDVTMVHHAVQDLKSKIIELDGKQGETLSGLGRLAFTFGSRDLETGRRTFDIEGPSRSLSVLPVELPQGTPARAMSLPPNSSVEPSSPSTPNRSTEHPLQGSNEDSGLMVHGMSNGVHASEVGRNESSSFGFSGLRPSGSGVNVVRRSCSARISFNI